MMREVQFTEYTIDTNGNDGHKIVFTTIDGEIVELPITDETKDTVMAHIKNMLRNETCRIEGGVEQPDIAKQLYDYSRSYLNRPEESEEQDHINMISAEEYLALSMMIERLGQWGIDSVPILKNALKYYAFPYDLTRHTIIKHCLSMFGEQ